MVEYYRDVPTEQLHNKLLGFVNRTPRKDSYKEECYKVCNDFCLRYTQQKKLSVISRGYLEEFVEFFAEEVYMMIVVAKRPITNFYTYLSACEKSILRQFYDLIGEGFEANNDKLSIYHNPASALRYSPFDIQSVYEKRDTESLALSMFMKYNKWLSHSLHVGKYVHRLNVHTSFLLSIKYGKFVSFHLDEEDAIVCRFIYNKYRLEMSKLIHDTSPPIISDEMYFKHTVAEIRGDYEDDEQI